MKKRPVVSVPSLTACADGLTRRNLMMTPPVMPRDQLGAGRRRKCVPDNIKAQTPRAPPRSADRGYFAMRSRGAERRPRRLAVRPECCIPATASAWSGDSEAFGSDDEQHSSKIATRLAHPPKGDVASAARAQATSGNIRLGRRDIAASSDAGSTILRPDHAKQSRTITTFALLLIVPRGLGGTANEHACFWRRAGRPVRGRCDLFCRGGSTGPEHR
jgi:hypothetical protein